MRVRTLPEIRFPKIVEEIRTEAVLQPRQQASVSQDHQLLFLSLTQISQGGAASCHVSSLEICNLGVDLTPALIDIGFFGLAVPLKSGISNLLHGSSNNLTVVLVRARAERLPHRTTHGAARSCTKRAFPARTPVGSADTPAPRSAED